MPTATMLQRQALAQRCLLSMWLLLRAMRKDLRLQCGILQLAPLWGQEPLLAQRVRMAEMRPLPPRGQTGQDGELCASQKSPRIVEPMRDLTIHGLDEPVLQHLRPVPQQRF